MTENRLRPWVVGHRGAMGHAPENTPASFALGWKMGADALECDVHMSRDKRLVVIHDPRLERTTSGAGLVRVAMWRAIRKLDAGAWFGKKFRGQRVYSLDDLLGWVRRQKSRGGNPLRLLVEIKNKPAPYPGIERAVAAALQRNRMVGRAGVISFDHGAVRRMRALLPGLFTGILFDEPLRNPWARAAWARANSLFPRRNLVTRALTQGAAQRGLFVGTWTVNEAAAMKKMIRLGVDAIATNFPDRLVRLLDKN